MRSRKKKRDEIEKEELEGAPQNSGEGETPDGNRKIIYFCTIISANFNMSYSIFRGKVFL